MIVVAPFDQRLVATAEMLKSASKSSGHSQ